MRAKLFFKKSSDSEFTELGIGQLRVLPGSGEGVKVLMRNDTSLGKVCWFLHHWRQLFTLCHHPLQVLLNVRVTTAIPVTSKNNNIFLVCVPNPPLEKVWGMGYGVTTV